MKQEFDKIIIRYGEIGLKTKRIRNKFEDKLVKNIKAAIEDKFEVKRAYGRIIIHGYNKDILNNLKKVFGIVSFSPCIKTTSKLEDIRKASSIKLKKGETFAVRCNRIGKHDYKSQEVARIVGADIAKKGKVDLTNPDKILWIDIRDKNAYIYTEILKGPGGIPAGVQGRVLCLIEDVNSVLASILMMKRGCYIYPVFYNVNEIEKFKKYILEWSWGLDLDFEEINSLKDIEKLMIEKSEVLVTGDYKLRNIRRFEDLGTVLMPLMGFNKKEIENLQKQYKIY